MEKVKRILTQIWMNKKMEKVKRILTQIWMNLNRSTLFLVICVFAVVGMWTVLGKLFVVAAASYVAFQVIRHWDDLRKTRWYDWLNPVKYANAVYGFFMKLMFPLHVIEQMALRMYDPECRKCVAKGTCLGCGCDMSKILVPWESCSEDNWGPVIGSRSRYERLRIREPVEVTVSYPNTDRLDILSPLTMTLAVWQVLMHLQKQNPNIASASGFAGHGLDRLALVTGYFSGVPELRRDVLKLNIAEYVQTHLQQENGKHKYENIPVFATLIGISKEVARLKS